MQKQIKKLEQVDKSKIFFIDESGIDNQLHRPLAKSKKGIKVFEKITGKRRARSSIISARNHNHKLFAPLIYDGTADTILILFWVGNILIPQLPPNSITVWDNATYHKSKKIKQLLEKHGHTIIFLPPYSPDLNPIEKLWGTLKQNLRSYFDETKSLTDNLIEQINRLCVKV
ncbi:MAG: IS630 family transposase [Thermales bacterium]|nr:IS630 family transposase [Thermales bacterium]